MRSAIHDALRLTFHNELRESLLPVVATEGRMRVRLATGELVNWLKARAKGYGREAMRLEPSPAHRALRRIVRQSRTFRELFEIRGNYLYFHRSITPEEQSEITRDVESHSEFPEDVLIRRVGSN